MNLTWRRITAHTKHPFRIARPGSSVAGDGTLVERIVVSIEHDGITGLGEAAPSPHYGQSLDSVERTLAAASAALGHDAGDIDAIVDRLLERFDDQRATVAAIDAALHDWLGKRRNLPVWQILGLDPTRTPPTSMTIGIHALDQIPALVAEAAGFDILKLKVGTDHDEQVLSTVRGLARQKHIRVDANCGWSAEEAPERIRQLRRFDLELIEQPIAALQHDALRRVREMSPVPIIADEDSIRPSDVAKLADVVDGVNIKLSKCGGIREARRMLTSARAHGLRVMLGCMVETSLGVAAAAQIASLTDFVDLDGHLLLADDPFTGLELCDGIVRPSDRPGLGVTLKSAAC
jgi:L-Ala-D/L-Glu epimerase